MPSRSTATLNGIPPGGNEAAVIDFGTARERQRVARYRTRAQSLLTQNRSALQRLYETGLIFTRHGTRVGRDLLQIQQHLLKAVDILNRAPKSDDEGFEGRLIEGEALFVQVEELLKKTTTLTERNRSAFQSTPSSF
jgi:hypothetical protein